MLSVSVILSHMVVTCFHHIKLNNRIGVFPHSTMSHTDNFIQCIFRVCSTILLKVYNTYQYSEIMKLKILFGCLVYHFTNISKNLIVYIFLHFLLIYRQW